MAKAQKLQIDATLLPDDLVISITCLLGITFQSVRNKGTGLIDVYMI